MSMSDDDRKLNSNEETVLETLRKDLSKKRDSQLKAEIRRIQTEGALTDKECQARVAEERRRAEEAMSVEEKQLRRKQVCKARQEWFGANYHYHFYLYSIQRTFAHLIYHYYYQNYYSAEHLH